jgi:shikimate dehydrogenase
VITGQTRVLAILGDPLEQARAPMLINAALAERGQDAVLVPLRVARGDLAPVIEGLRAVESFRGAVVTMPHKSAVVALLDDVSPEARQLGACNVIRRDPDGRLIGTMLDGEGFTAALRRAGHDVLGQRVFLAGAGLPPRWSSIRRPRRFSLPRPRADAHSSADCRCSSNRSAR